MPRGLTRDIGDRVQQTLGISEAIDAVDWERVSGVVLWDTPQSKCSLNLNPFHHYTPVSRRPDITSLHSEKKTSDTNNK